MPNNILIIDDELSIRESFLLILEDKYQVHLAPSGEAGLKILNDKKIDLAYLDIRMPGLNGIQTLKKIKEADPNIEVVMVTAVNDVQKTSEAVRLGAYDYVVKPFEVNHILKLTEKLLRKKSIKTEEIKAAQTLEEKKLINIGNSEKILKVLNTVSKLKKEDHVLLVGEVGTEKELIASLIYEKRTGRKTGLKSLFLSKSMSHKQIKDMVNTESTLFIDNFEYLPKDTKPLNFIAGSSQELNLESFVVIKLPRLAVRIPDIPVLALHFLEKFNLAYRNNLEFNQEALETLSNYKWPGNTAELETIIERLVLSLNKKQIEIQDLPFSIMTKTVGPVGSDFVADFGPIKSA